MEKPAQPWLGSHTLVTSGAVAGIAGFAAWIVGLFVDTRQALYGYLTAYMYTLTIVLGALIFLMIIHAARAEWPVAFRGIVERLAALLPFLTVLFLPIALGIRRIYPWAGEPSAGTHLADVVRHQAPYLNVPFTIGRAVFFLGLWSAMAVALIRWSRRTEETGDPRWKVKQWRLSGIGLVVVALTLTFFSIDWIMSLTPTWFSTIFGFYVFAGGFVAAFALVAVLMAAAERLSAFQGVLRPGHFLSMGKLELAFIIFWTYMAFAQYLIIWIGDIPHEASWYQTRSEGWAGVSIVLIAIHFVIPFSILLWRDMKRRPSQLRIVSVWILAAHYLDMYWLVMPALHPGGPRLHWLDLAAPLFVCGTCVAVGAWGAAGRVLVPWRDPDMVVATAYEGT